jgi:phage tail-like protein
MGSQIESNPVGNFRFELVFTETKLSGAGGSGTTRPIAGGAFAECTGLEVTMEPKVIKEGGRNYGAHQRAGAVNFATVVLRRGITPNTHLWAWFNQLTLQGGYAYRMDVDIHHLDIEGQIVRTWHLDRAMPVKFKSSDLNAKSGEVAIEELHLVHEGLQLR